MFPQDIYTKAQLGGEAVNTLRCKLSAAITSSDTTIPVDSTTGFPDGTSGFCFLSIGAVGIDAECIRYTSKDTTNFYCPATQGRNYDGRGAYAHSANDYVRLAYPAEIHNRMCETIAELQTFVRDQARAAVYAQAAADIPAFAVLYYDANGKFNLAKADALTTSLVQGMSIYPIQKNAYGIACEGIITNPDWNWNAQKRLWLSGTQAGELTESEPVNPNFSIWCGVTKTATSIRFRMPDLGAITKF